MSIKTCYPDSTMLSFAQVRNRLKSITGVLPLHFDMCINSCIAFTSIFSELIRCPSCGEPRYENSNQSTPRRQFVTLPLGPQLQALWRNPVTVAKLQDRLRRTAEVLSQQNDEGGIQDYDDICCGTEYLNLVKSSQISDHDMLLNVFVDGAQLYRDKESDSWFGIATLVDLPPELRYSQEFVLPLFLIGGPNAPKHYDSFLFPTFSHLSACQRLGLPIWNSTAEAEFVSTPWFAFGGADTVGMAEFSGWVGHHGRNGCRLLCSMPGRHKPGIGTYYPAMLRPNGKVPKGSSHADINVTQIATPLVESYNERLNYLLVSASSRQYEKRRRETGIRKPSIVSGLPKSIPAPKCFPADTMHLFLNISQLLVSLLHGSIEHSKDDDPCNWDFAILHENDTWKAHGMAVANASRHIPTCIESRVPRNPAEKISSGYKAIEFLVYIFCLCPALLYHRLPPYLYKHFCKLVFATRVIHQHHKSRDELLAAHRAFLEFVLQFEIFYYQRKMTRLHFVRPCIHALVHLVPEHFRIGSLIGVSQWTMERTIGNLGEEIRLHSDPYANLSQRMVERSQTNALKSIAPDIIPTQDKLPRGALDLGKNFVLLHPQDLHLMDNLVSNALTTFSALQNWTIVIRNSMTVTRFARLLLPNGQVARSLWHEKKRPDEKVRPARYVKVALSLDSQIWNASDGFPVFPEWRASLCRNPLLFSCSQGKCSAYTCCHPGLWTTRSQHSCRFTQDTGGVQAARRRRYSYY